MGDSLQYVELGGANPSFRGITYKSKYLGVMNRVSS